MAQVLELISHQYSDDATEQVRIDDELLQRGHRLEVSIHDRTRLEWIASAPLTDDDLHKCYSVEMTLDVPEHLWVRHELWPAFRARSRLQAPDQMVYDFQTRSILDEIRHEALRMSRGIKRQERGILRLIEGGAAYQQAVRDLTNSVVQSRRMLQRAGDTVDEATATEAMLADEYISVTYLSALARLKPHLDSSPSEAQSLQHQVNAERRYREAMGWPTPRGGSRRELEKWLRRRGALKRHFHQLLWLDAEEYRPDDRLSNWIAAFVAVVASTWAFAWHVAYMNQLVSGGMSMVSMMLAGALAGVLYAVKDRIKEIGRRWIARRVREGFADKVVRLYLQERVDPRRGRLLTSRERIRATRTARADPLNPAIGATHKVLALHIAMNMEQHGLKVPGNWGVGGVKHVMRYDLSALFPRMSRGQRPVPVTSRKGEVHYESVRKRYEIGFTCRITDAHDDVLIEEKGRLSLDHEGLRQIKPAKS